MPYGSIRAGVTSGVTDFKFTDQELDSETGLYNYRSRLYDPVLARFISPDSIIPDLYDPQQINRYAYARNNPLKYYDPTGHFVTEIGRGNHTTDENLQKDIVGRIKSGRGFDEDKGKEQNYKNTLETVKLYTWAKYRLAGIPIQNYPPAWTMQFGLTFTYGWYGPVANKAFGLVAGNSWEEGMQIGVYAMGGVGGIWGDTADAGIEVIASGNKNIKDLGGLGKTTGGSASPSQLGKAAVGIEVNEPLSGDSESSYSLNITTGVGTAVEAHHLRTATAVMRLF